MPDFAMPHEYDGLGTSTESSYCQYGPGRDFTINGVKT